MNDDREEIRADELQNTEAPSFDELEFVRRARAKSLRRTVAIATAVALATLAAVGGAWVAWDVRIQAESNRISTYQYELIALSRPNTHITGTGSTDLRFPGARNTYVTYRPVGLRPMPLGELVIDYDFWGGEVTDTEGGEVMWRPPAREFTGTNMVPALRFLYPQKRHSSVRPIPKTQESAEEEKQFKTHRRDAEQRLGSAPASATAELALSFQTLKTLDDVEDLLPEGVTLNWGAVDVWEPGEGPVTTADGHVVGVSFISPDGNASPLTAEELQQDLIDDLRFVAQEAPKGTADRCTQSADFIKGNGVAYYGIVVTGPVAKVRPLLDLDDVSSAMLGFVVEPWE